MVKKIPGKKTWTSLAKLTPEQRRQRLNKQKRLSYAKVSLERRRAYAKQHVAKMDATIGREQRLKRRREYLRVYMERIRADPAAYLTFRGQSKNRERAYAARCQLHAPSNALSMHTHIKASISRDVHPELREDLVQELFAAVLACELRLDQITDRHAIKPYLARVRKLMPDERRQVSLDTAIPGTEGLTYLDMLEAQPTEEEEFA